MDTGIHNKKLSAGKLRQFGYVPLTTWCTSGAHSNAHLVHTWGTLQCIPGKPSQQQLTWQILLQYFLASMKFCAHCSQNFTAQVVLIHFLILVSGATAQNHSLWNTPDHKDRRVQQPGRWARQSRQPQKPRRSRGPSQPPSTAKAALRRQKPALVEKLRMS